MMDHYTPGDVTAQAREICRRDGSGDWSGDGSGGMLLSSSEPSFGAVTSRALNTRCLFTEGKVIARRIDCLQFDQIDVDLRGVEQLVEISQVRTIANIFIYIHQHDLCNGTLTLSNMLDEIERIVQEKGLE